MICLFQISMIFPWFFLFQQISSNSHQIKFFLDLEANLNFNDFSRAVGTLTRKRTQTSVLNSNLVQIFVVSLYPYLASALWLIKVCISNLCILIIVTPLSPAFNCFIAWMWAAFSVPCIHRDSNQILRWATLRLSNKKSSDRDFNAVPCNSTVSHYCIFDCICMMFFVS